ncbi:MAG TPA: Ig-like domain-containing protein, partial [Fulvivirga sp.]|nr:Ig-like domain-containing protein [Fulvivirga sp.]
MRSLLTILFSIYLFTVNAQITDDFQDGDFTNNPPWLSSDLSGNGADFQVNSGELQSFGPTSTAQLSITTSGIPDLTNFKVTWQFKARYASAPSSSNKIEVFLLSNNPDLNAAPEGYFIRMGETGSDDGIDFYKTSSGTPLILDANPSVASGIDVNIKVTRLTDGTWTIEADPTGGTSFTTIGSVNDSEFTTGNNFGFKVYHTSTRNQDFFFDDVSVMQTGVDTTPPSLNTLQVSGSNQLLLTFSEDLDQSSAETTTNYSLNNSVGSPQAAVLSPANQVTLTFSNDFANGDYTLTINNIDDLNANTLISTTSDFTIFVPDVPVIRDVIINELMADPAPAIGLPDAEFVELYNNSNKTF